MTQLVRQASSVEHKRLRGAADNGGPRGEVEVHSGARAAEGKAAAADLAPGAGGGEPDGARPGVVQVAGGAPRHALRWRRNLFGGLVSTKGVCN